MILTFLIITLTFLNIFLTNFNGSVEFAVCSGITFREGSYRMKTGLPICSINPWTVFRMVGNFSGGYCQTDCNFNFNNNVYFTADIYMNSSFNFSFFTATKRFTCFYEKYET